MGDESCQAPPRPHSGEGHEPPGVPRHGENRRPYLLHWSLRAAIALFAGNVLGYGCTEMHLWAMVSDNPSFGIKSGFIEFVVLPSATILTLALFALLGTLIKAEPERETRCRRCGHILRGISEPRCSE